METGPAPEEIPLASYVLSEIPDGVRPLIAPSVKEAADKIVSMLE